MAIGIGYFRAKASQTRGDVPDAVGSGSGMAGEIGLGGTPAPGLVLGGRILWGTSRNVTTDNSLGAIREGGADLGMLQFFGDLYPDPSGGFHVQAGIGPAFLKYYHGYSGGYDVGSASGLSLTGGAGWEGWVGARWAIGGMVNLSGAWVKDSGVSNNISVISPTLTFTITYN